MEGSVSKSVTQSMLSLPGRSELDAILHQGSGASVNSTLRCSLPNHQPDCSVVIMHQLAHTQCVQSALPLCSQLHTQLCQVIWRASVLPGCAAFRQPAHLRLGAGSMQSGSWARGTWT